jgi:hypothetical protein
VLDLRAAEAPVDDFEVGEVVLERLPQADAGAADEEDAAGFGSGFRVGFFERADLLLERCGRRGRGLCGGDGRKQQREQRYDRANVTHHEHHFW